MKKKYLVEETNVMDIETFLMIQDAVAKHLEK
jgi:hypothetical protein